MVAFFRQKTNDQELALLLADAADKNGRDGHVEVRHGGIGNPYTVEYSHRPEDEISADRRTFAEVRAEINTFKTALKSAGTEEEHDRLERQIAWLAGGICTLWINTPSSAEYQRLRSLIRKSVTEFKEACSA